MYLDKIKPKKGVKEVIKTCVDYVVNHTHYGGLKAIGEARQYLKQ